LLQLTPSAPPGFAHRTVGATTMAKVEEENDNKKAN
jgi:hypothetical protein